MNKNLQSVFDTCKKIEGVELNIVGENCQVRWNQLVVDCDSKNFDRVFNAIKVISDNGAYFE